MPIFHSLAYIIAAARATVGRTVVSLPPSHQTVRGRVVTDEENRLVPAACLSAPARAAPSGGRVHLHGRPGPGRDPPPALLRGRPRQQRLGREDALLDQQRLGHGG